MNQYPTRARSSDEILDASEVQLGVVQVAEPAGLVFPAEDRGQSLAEMAQRDLDAALQLLVDRAQYITGASGAAIALRHEGEHDMLCRASAGQNAPELGALLSAEFGLSGESVRTGQALHCDDAEHDGRVNRESCRELGIASVAVVPIVSDGEVLGVFELFSGKAFAFGERDVAALQRLAEMVETAVRIARAAGVPGLAGDAARLELRAAGDFVEPGHEEFREPEALDQSLVQVEEAPSLAPGSAAAPTAESLPSEQVAILKPVLWSASGTSEKVEGGVNGGGIPVDGNLPMALRELRKCEACGFPVSEGRRLCLDCDEKDWRGRARGNERTGRPAATLVVATVATAAPAVSTIVAQDLKTESPPPPLLGESGDDVPMPILSAALEHSPSWWSANKYALIAIVVVVLAIGATLWLR
jgi:hypothetical protein